MRKICIFTGTRAEYGILKPLMTKIRQDDGLVLQTLVSGAHLSPSLGFTIQEIEADGFDIHEKVDMHLDGDGPPDILRSMGLGMTGFGQALARLRPDMLVILGDRYEAFCAAASALVSTVPVAHLHGGELSEGAMDDAFRHSITKMSHLHFVSTATYRNRVIQLGESPDRVFHVGALGVENSLALPLASQSELGRLLEFSLDEPYLLITFHPATLEPNQAENQINALLDALDDTPHCRFIFTMANADSGGTMINGMVAAWVAENSHRSRLYPSLGQYKYLSAMKHAQAVVGNSSSGIIEAPSLGVPTVNIGDRQKGRIRAESVIDCRADTEDIRRALAKALSASFRKQAAGVINPYQGKDTAETIKEIIRTMSLENIMKKTFMDVVFDPDPSV